jgi:taurine dioxygenase
MTQHAADVVILPVDNGLACEIRGIDVTAPMDAAAFARIEAAFDQYGVLFCRGQDVSPAAQVEFSSRFGDVAVNFNSDKYGVADAPEIFAIGNAERDGEDIALKGVGQTWHSDMCYSAEPPRATMLFAVEVPTLHGLTLGDTCFANAARAFDALPATMQQHLAGRLATFDFRGRQRSRPVPAETVAKYPPVQHPIVRSHPRTGRQSLYVMRDDCTAIEGLDEAEGAALTQALADHVLRPEFIYRHQWQAGDLLMWDNCTVQHRALNDYAAPQTRLLHRSTIASK